MTLGNVQNPHDLSIEEIEAISDEGECSVECKCGRIRTLEPDGYCTCLCGALLESPLLTLGYI